MLAEVSAHELLSRTLSRLAKPLIKANKTDPMFACLPDLTTGADRLFKGFEQHKP